MIHDDTLPDRNPEDEPEESEWERVEREELERDGLVERGGVMYFADHDPFAVSCLLARVSETLDHLHAVNLELEQSHEYNAELQTSYEQLFGVANQLDGQFQQLLTFYRNLETGVKDTIAAYKSRAADCERLHLQNETLRAELAEIKAAAQQYNERPVASALFLLAHKFLNR